MMVPRPLEVSRVPIAHEQPGAVDEIRIEPMTPGDVPMVLAIERRSFPTPWSEGAFVSELRDNAYAEYIVARRGSRLIGYAGMWCILDEAHVTTIAVDPDFRGRGVGHRLLTALEERALRHGCRRMTLEVRVSNHVAQKLYLRHGFRPCGRRRGYYVDNGEDAIIMWRERLDPPGPVVQGDGGDGPGSAGAAFLAGSAGAGARDRAAGGCGPRSEAEPGRDARRRPANRHGSAAPPSQRPPGGEARDGHRPQPPGTRQGEGTGMDPEELSSHGLPPAPAEPGGTAGCRRGMTSPAAASWALAGGDVGS